MTQSSSWRFAFRQRNHGRDDRVERKAVRDDRGVVRIAVAAAASGGDLHREVREDPDTIASAKRFAVNILAAHQGEISTRFAPRSETSSPEWSGTGTLGCR